MVWGIFQGNQITVTLGWTDNDGDLGAVYTGVHDPDPGVSLDRAVAAYLPAIEADMADWLTDHALGQAGVDL